MTWLVMNVPAAGVRVGRLNNGSVEYRTDASGQPIHYQTRQAARRAAEKLNVGELPSRCTEAELLRMVSGLHVRDKMMLALRLLLVDGQTWRSAAEQSGVTQSGILRSLRRIVNANLTRS